MNELNELLRRAKLLRRGKAYQNYLKNQKKAYIRNGILSTLIFFSVIIIGEKTESVFACAGLFLVGLPLYSPMKSKKQWSCPYCGEDLPVISSHPSRAYSEVYSPDEFITDCPHCHHSLLYPD